MNKYVSLYTCECEKSSLSLQVHPSFEGQQLPLLDFKWHYKRCEFSQVIVISSCRHGNVFIEAKTGRTSVYIPDKDDFHFGWGALDDGGCILVTVAIKDLPIDLTE